MMTALSPAPARRSVSCFVAAAGVMRPDSENPATVGAGRGFQELEIAKQGVFAMPKNRRADARAQEPSLIAVLTPAGADHG